MLTYGPSESLASSGRNLFDDIAIHTQREAHSW